MKKIGIYNPYLESRGGGEKVCLALAAELSKNDNSQVFLISHSEVDLSPLENYFNLDLSKVGVRIINTQRWFFKLLFKLPFLGGLKHFVSDLYVANKLRGLNCDIFINNYYQSNLPNMGKYGVYMCMFPQKLTVDSEKLGRLKAAYKNCLTWLYKKFIYKSQKDGIYTYQKIVANSAYTKTYIKKYWDLDSEILYPICENMHDTSVHKEKMILNVGRLFGFDEGSHHKRQDFLLDTFIKMKQLQAAGWQLHFAGTVANDKKAKKFVNDLKQRSHSLPVFFHLNASFDELKKLYNQATIYWHATGYGSSIDDNPEKHEHFGISTVEAMSAGAIPVVINSAGQKEIVKDGLNGYLWNDQAELVKLSEKVLRLDKAQQTKLNAELHNTAVKFSINSFSKNVHDIFDDLVE